MSVLNTYCRFACFSVELDFKLQEDKLQPLMKRLCPTEESLFPSLSYPQEIISSTPKRKSKAEAKKHARWKLWFLWWTPHTPRQDYTTLSPSCFKDGVQRPDAAFHEHLFHVGHSHQDHSRKYFSGWFCVGTFNMATRWALNLVWEHVSFIKKRCIFTNTYIIYIKYGIYFQRKGIVISSCRRAWNDFTGSITNLALLHLVVLVWTALKVWKMRWMF